MKRDSLWEPLTFPRFRPLWAVQVMASVALWAHVVTGQWVLTTSSASTTAVASIQTALTLPFFLLALPAGLVADVVDRRSVLVVVQAVMAGTSGVLAVLVFAGGASQSAVLISTCFLGAGSAAAVIAWQSLIPELVERRVVASAAVLDGMSFNASRALGPALAGVVLSLAGAGWVFAAGAVAFAFAAGASARWVPRPAAAKKVAEPLGSALQAGIRFVRHSPWTRRLLLRVVMFTLPASIVYALLPVIAHERLGVGPSALGGEFAALGMGAVAGTLALHPLRRRLSANAAIGFGSVVHATVLVLVALARSPWFVAPLLMVSAAVWVGVLTTMMAAAQTVLPSWVRARAIAIVLLVHQGAMAFGSLLWGGIADLFGAQMSMLLAGLVMAASGVSARWWGLRSSAAADPQPVSLWEGDESPGHMRSRLGPVAVLVEYDVPTDHVEAFLTAMQPLGRSRRRIGARRWELFVDSMEPGRFVESYLVASWGEYVMQERHRWTRADKRLKDAAERFAVGCPVVRHLLSVEAGDARGGATAGAAPNAVISLAPAAASVDERLVRRNG
jgi:MFS family permease